MNNLKLILISIAATLLVGVIVYMGIQSKKIKELAAKLLKAKADLELDKLQDLVDNQKEAVNDTRKKASAKRSAYRNALKSIGVKSKS